MPLDTKSATLVIRPERLGDLVLATPTIRALKLAFPDKALCVLTDSRYGDLLQFDPHVDKVLKVYWKGRKKDYRSSWLDIRKDINATGYSFKRAAILYPECMLWNWLMASLGVHSVAQIGGTWPALLLGHSMVLRRRYKQEKHFAELFADVAIKLGAKTNDLLPRLYLYDEEVTQLKNRFNFLQKIRPRLLIHPLRPESTPGLGDKGYAFLIEELAKESDFEICLVGSGKRAEAWKGRFARYDNVKEDLLDSLNLRELMAACRLASAMIADSTGVIHVAAALGTPVFGFYSNIKGAAPSVWGPRSQLAECFVFDTADGKRAEFQSSSVDFDLTKICRKIASKIKSIK
jgi:ADP-heptose:LPS heptosyltransferase